MSNRKREYIYGNMPGYYGYRLSRHAGCEGGDVVDPRLRIIPEYLIRNKKVLDVGCNSGVLTLQLVKRYNPFMMLGIDLDDSLISHAISNYRNELESEEERAASGMGGGGGEVSSPDPFLVHLAAQHPDLTKPPLYFPISLSMTHVPRNASSGLHNTRFKTANIVTDDFSDIYSQFDVIMCFSVTKWIHLNWGDDGLKKAFRVMYNLLAADGVLLLEYQQFDRYKKKVAPEHRATFHSIKFLPEQFSDYLLGIGFERVEDLGAPPPAVNVPKAFSSHIYAFYKSQDNVIPLT